MKRAVVDGLIDRELKRSKVKWPGFPNDPVHAAAIVAEEAGELTQATLNYTYGPPRFKDSQSAMIEEAVHTAAMAIRFLVNFPYSPGNDAQGPDRNALVRARGRGKGRR